MLNGRYDFFFPVESSQDPMFRLLGTPAADKRHVVVEGSHEVPRAMLIQEVLGWLDKYQPLPARQLAPPPAADRRTRFHRPFRLQARPCPGRSWPPRVSGPARL